jgi:uncharacterized protein YxeA
MKKILISLMVLVVLAITFGITVSAQEPQISDSSRRVEINAEMKKVKMQFKQFQIWMSGKIKSFKN